jgi:hypothetical protein
MVQSYLDASVHTVCRYVTPPNSRIGRSAPIASYTLDAVAGNTEAASHETARRGAVSILACFAEYSAQLVIPLQGVLRRHDCSAHESVRVGLGLAALGNYHQAAFGVDNLEFVASAKRLALDAAAGNTEAARTCLFIRMKQSRAIPRIFPTGPDKAGSCPCNTHHPRRPLVAESQSPLLKIKSQRHPNSI